MNKNQMNLIVRDALDLNALLDNGIENIPKRFFQKIKKKLKRGDQLFLFRSDPWKFPVSIIMKYAHVVVYIGDGFIVHTCKDSYAGLAMSTFKKEPIQDVIKDDDQVFFGHDIPVFSHSFNIR